MEVVVVAVVADATNVVVIETFLDVPIHLERHVLVKCFARFSNARCDVDDDSYCSCCCLLNLKSNKKKTKKTKTKKDLSTSDAGVW